MHIYNPHANGHHKVFLADYCMSKGLQWVVELPNWTDSKEDM